MLRRGTRVTRLMQRVGQIAPTGRIIESRRDGYEIRWDDGHTSVTSRFGIVPLKNDKKS